MFLSRAYCQVRLHRLEERLRVWGDEMELQILVGEDQPAVYPYSAGCVVYPEAMELGKAVHLTCVAPCHFRPRLEKLDQHLYASVFLHRLDDRDDPEFGTSINDGPVEYRFRPSQLADGEVLTVAWVYPWHLINNRKK